MSTHSIPKYFHAYLERSISYLHQIYEILVLCVTINGFFRMHVMDTYFNSAKNFIGLKS